MVSTTTMEYMTMRRALVTLLLLLLALVPVLVPQFSKVQSQALPDQAFGVSPDPDTAIPDGPNRIGVFDGSTGNLLSCVQMRDADNSPLLDESGNPDWLNVELALIAETSLPPGYQFQALATYPFDPGAGRDCSGTYNSDTGLYEDIVKVQNAGSALDGIYHIRMETDDPDALTLGLQQSALIALPHINDAHIEFNNTVTPGSLVQVYALDTASDVDFPWPDCAAEMVWGDQRLPLQTRLMLDLPDGRTIEVDEALDPGELGIGSFSIVPRCVAVLSGEEQSADTPAVTLIVIDSLPDITEPTQATLDVSPASLDFTLNATGDITITNASSASVTATNIAATIPAGSNLSIQSTTCAAELVVASSCIITFAATALEGPVDVTIAGDNTNTVTVPITVSSGSTLTGITPASGSASGGTGVTLTGTGLTGATSVSFGGLAATSVNVVNSSTITAVTPAGVTGAVDVVVSTPAGGATLTDGYTYLTTAVGQTSGGGVIAALEGGFYNLIASVADASAAAPFGGHGIFTGAASTEDGAANTLLIVDELGAGSYAANMCHNHEVDSQGNTPCQAGNTCYNDWFLPARVQLLRVFTNRADVGGFAPALYYSSTESLGDSTLAWVVDFVSGAEVLQSKDTLQRVRCVRSFTP